MQFNVVLIFSCWFGSIHLSWLYFGSHHICCILGNDSSHGHPFAIRFFDHHYLKYNLLSSSCWKWQKLEVEKPMKSLLSFHFTRIGLFPAVYERVYFGWQWNSHYLVVHLADKWRAAWIKSPWTLWNCSPKL